MLFVLPHCDMWRSLCYVTIARIAAAANAQLRREEESTRATLQWKKGKKHTNQFKLKVINMLRNGHSIDDYYWNSVFTDWHRIISCIFSRVFSLRFAIFSVSFHSAVYNYFVLFSFISFLYYYSLLCIFFHSNL